MLDIVNAFGGGIQAIRRIAKGKSKDKLRESGSDPFTMTSDDRWGIDRLGTNGLPGGIVFSDRMGDQEMDGRGILNPNVVEIIYVDLS